MVNRILPTVFLLQPCHFTGSFFNRVFLYRVSFSRVIYRNISPCRFTVPYYRIFLQGPFSYHVMLPCPFTLSPLPRTTTSC